MSVSSANCSFAAGSIGTCLLLRKRCLGVKTRIERVVFVKLLEEPRLEKMVQCFGLVRTGLQGLLKVADGLVVLQTVKVLKAALGQRVKIALARGGACSPGVTPKAITKTNEKTRLLPGWG